MITERPCWKDRVAGLSARLSPSHWLAAQHLQRKRDRVDRLLAKLSVAQNEHFQGTVFVDTTWDNPNYWARYALLRRALGLSAGREIGIVGLSRKKFCRRTWSHFKPSAILDRDAYLPPLKSRRSAAKALLAQAQNAEDILKWDLPMGFPSDIFYDALLKLQRLAQVDLRDPRLEDWVAEGLCYLDAAQRLFEEETPQLYVASHVNHYRYASLVWAALLKKIPVILLYGDFGVLRFAKINHTTEIYDWVNRPRPADLAGLTPQKKARLIQIGSNYLEQRWGGKTDDIGSVYAYQQSKNHEDHHSLCRRFGWDINKPIVGVYAGNSFDYPHGYGMRNFTDFQDWIQTTLKTAIANPQVQWVFRAHPCDDWYRGVTLADLMAQDPAPHVRLAPKGIHGRAFLKCLDGVVTVHGTIGIEAAASGKPVLLADRGWYDDAGFAQCPETRQDYLDRLSQPWWENNDLENAATNAQCFAGFFFGHPDWQTQLKLADDSAQDAIYDDIPRLFQSAGAALDEEISLLRKWHDNDHRFYHIYKMRNDKDA